ncbi:MAG TPA: hypothetical protein ENN80_10080 [Candidatus Hydrogenedentes bacterium]|nr:hypothetical protein [Candidatus Hydrogenedentota bacterium]
MQAFDAVITRDGTVHHVAWEAHTGIVARCGIPENTSIVRQNYWEYDLRVPFTGGYNGLQLRDVEEPPEAVVAAAEHLTERLCDWHRGRGLDAIPEDWGDVVEHVYGMMGEETPKFLNGRGGVRFAGRLAELDSGTLCRLIGAARVGRLCGSARVEAVWASARVDEMADAARIGVVYEAGIVGVMRDAAAVEMLCQSAVVSEMHDRSRVMIMHGASRVLALHGSSAAARGCDGVVSTPDAEADARALLAEDARWREVSIIPAGTGVLA